MKTSYACAGLVGLALCVPAWGQVDIERFERQLEQIQRQTRMRADTAIPTDQRALLDYGGFLTFNFLALDDQDQNTHILRQTDLNAYARLNLDNVHEFFVRVRTSYRDFNAGDDFDGKGDDWVEPTLDRATYRFDLARYLAAYQGTRSDLNVVVKGGRQLVHWVNGLTLSQEIDGAMVDFSYGSLTLEAVAGMTRDSTIDIDSSRPQFDGDTHRGFYGGMLSYQVTPEHRPFVYGLVQKDDNDRDFSADPLLATRTATGLSTAELPVLPTRFYYDTYYIGFGSTGNLGDQMLYGVEIVYEGGKTLSNSFSDVFAPITQTKDDVEAMAADVKLDYLFNDANRTRAVGELVIASGDVDRLTTTNTFGGNRTGTSDHAFNAFGLINTGLAFAPNVSNLLLVRTGLSTFPLPDSPLFGRLQVGVNALVFNKLNRHAPIDEGTSDQTYLGSEADLFANWQITSDLSLAVRYGVFFPGSAINTDHDPRHFFFTGLTFAF